MEYKFYGWETADVPTISEEYKDISNPRELYDKLSKIWCEYTCAPRMRDKWNRDNITCGQCSITAFLAQDIFGGTVYGVPRSDGNFHCYNVVGDCVFDLTSEQFGDEKLCYEGNPVQQREVHFQKEEKRERYEYLKKQLKESLKNNIRKILITNDDGIKAEGLARLARAALKYGEVWVVAPASERSAASHSIALRSPVDVYPADFPVEGVHAFSCSGTPADCVRVGSISVMPYKPDVVLSGINFGYNTASDIQYSATVGAAFEAEFQGFRAIALSEGTGEHEVTDRYLDEILAELIDKDPGRGRIFNVNFPQCTLEKCGGVLRDRKVSKSMLFEDGYKLLEELEHGGMRYMVDGRYREAAGEGTDLRAVLDGYVSVGVVNNIC